MHIIQALLSTTMQHWFLCKYLIKYCLGDYDWYLATSQTIVVSHYPLIPRQNRWVIDMISIINCGFAPCPHPLGFIDGIETPAAIFHEPQHSNPDLGCLALACSMLVPNTHMIW